MHEQDAFIGVRDIWGGDKPFSLRATDRRQHLYTIGKTGTGKSTLLRNLIIQDVAAGRGVGLIDPHGDLAEELLDFVPPWRTDHVVYFNPGDYENPLGLNLLDAIVPESPHLVASSVVSALKGIWRESWGPRLEYILSAAIAALQECQNVSLLGVQRMLVDQRYRQWVIRQVKDPIVRAFWEVEYKSYDPRLLSESIAPIQNKVGQLLLSRPMRNILGQVRSTFDASFVMNKKRIFIANLAKGRIGEDKSNLLGSILVTQFHLAALARAGVPPAERNDFNLFVDEFPSFATDSFASILSQSRKYGLSLVLANQYLAQLQPDVRDAVFGNVGTMIAFRVGEPDAQLLLKENRTVRCGCNRSVTLSLRLKQVDGNTGHEFERAASIGSDVTGSRREAFVGQRRNVVEAERSAGPAGLEALSSSRRHRACAWSARQAQQSCQEEFAEAVGAAAICGALRGFRSDAGGGEAEAGWP